METKEEEGFSRHTWRHSVGEENDRLEEVGGGS